MQCMMPCSTAMSGAAAGNLFLDVRQPHCTQSILSITMNTCLSILQDMYFLTMFGWENVTLYRGHLILSKADDE
jgi:hypothetical protein